jgi:hypothetical protein
LGLAVTAGTLLALAPSASAAPATCPGSFEVLHNDRIGAVQLPRGPYTITVLNSATMGCTEASRLFAEFLEDFDGRLPRPWVATASTRTFQAGRGSTTGFRVAPRTTPPVPPTPPSPRVCPGYFSVLHNDRIGRFRIARGRYKITLLSYAGVSCSQAGRLFAQFLQDYNGVLPRPWLLDPGTGTFSRGHRQVGFRIKPYVPQAGDGGSGQFPVAGETRCRPTFRVQNNDRIGRLRLRRGNYNVWVQGLTCPRASRLFAQFLRDTDGVLARPWVLNVTRATFTRGRGGNVRFRVKPVRR